MLIDEIYFTVLLMLEISVSKGSYNLDQCLTFLTLMDFFMS